MVTITAPETLSTADAFCPGAYLTDGISLYGVVSELPQAPSLRLVEDCRTLDVLIMTVDELIAADLEPVFGS
jgi:hypothetical protein